jgi:hypothetical protein
MSSHPTFGYLANVIPSATKTNFLLFTANAGELTEARVIVNHKNPYPTKIRIAVGSSATSDTPSSLKNEYIYYNCFVDEGETFHSDSLFIADGQKVFVWADRPDTNFVLEGITSPLPTTGSGLLAHQHMAALTKQNHVLYSTGAGDEATIILYAVNQGSQTARLRVGVTDIGGNISPGGYYDYNVRVQGGQSYIRKTLRLSENQSLVVRTDYGELSFIALGTFNFEVATQTSLSLPGNLSVGGTSTFSGPSTFSDSLTINGGQILGYNTSTGELKYTLDPTNGTLDAGAVSLSAGLTMGGTLNVNDVFTVDPETGNVNIAGSLTAGTFDFDLSIDGDLDLLNNKVINMANPVVASDAATKSYTDSTAIAYAIALS